MEKASVVKLVTEQRCTDSARKCANCYWGAPMASAPDSTLRVIECQQDTPRAFMVGLQAEPQLLDKAPVNARPVFMGVFPMLPADKVCGAHQYPGEAVLNFTDGVNQHRA